MSSHFKTELGKEEILSLYNEELNDLDIEYKYLKVNSSYGFTNIIITGKPSNPPLIILHESNACAPISLETYPAYHENSKYLQLMC